MTTETYNYDDVTTGSDQIATTLVTVSSGQNLAKYTPIGQVTSTGEFVASVRTATNGSQNPVYITAQAVDATGGDTAAQVFKAGTFDPEMLAWDASHNAVSKLLAFVGTPISLQKPAAVL
ncbi:head decoration protein [Glaciecola siphonariae]|uniref:Head decoration protein n=1 Tax=Glaciecola siphonariae TaxID=521012 RepID=A0ABV9LT57_9ALTE